MSIAHVFALDAVPESDEAEVMAAAWAPYRSTAARMLWHDYLGGASYVASPDAGFLQ